MTDEYGLLTTSRNTLSIVVHSEKVNPMCAHERKRWRVLFLVLYLHFFLTTIGRSTIDDDHSSSNAPLCLSKREEKETFGEGEIERGRRVKISSASLDILFLSCSSPFSSVVPSENSAQVVRWHGSGEHYSGKLPNESLCTSLFMTVQTNRGESKWFVSLKETFDGPLRDFVVFW